MVMTPKICPVSTMPPSMRSNEPKSPAGLRPMRWSMISTGTRIRGSTNGGVVYFCTISSHFFISG